jgi:hypothetical protein
MSISPYTVIPNQLWEMFSVIAQIKKRASLRRLFQMARRDRRPAAYVFDQVIIAPFLPVWYYREDPLPQQ